MFNAPLLDLSPPSIDDNERVHAKHADNLFKEMIFIYL